ncbi:MAG: YbaB/EbfC family nucleoid-associated protein [Propionibacteriales bacterium]|nr:YbaB/EbfC family nucleoid-associated protein [Propionibacteriales bacterium]
MTQNPLGEGANPFGNLDLGAMLEQAQQMQAQLMAAQAQLAETLVEGSAGGVEVTVTGTGELSGVRIVPGSFDGADAESLADLGDLVVAAFRDAKAKVDAAASAALGPMAGALDGSLGGLSAPPARPAGF